MPRIKKLKIMERKLGRESADGLYWDNLIEIDPRQNSKEYMDTCVHELLHHADPTLSESKIYKLSAIITKGLWQQNFRRIMR